MSLLQEIEGSLSQEMIGEIAGQLGQDQDQTAKAVSAALPVLVSALAKNTEAPEGAESLNRALDKHDGSILDSLGGLFSDPDSGEGGGILGHILGDRTSVVESAVSQIAGLDSSSSSSILKILAPIVLAYLGRKKQSEPEMDAGGLADLLRQDREETHQRAPKEMSVLESLLDRDNDGNVSDDLTQMGTSLLGSFLKGM